ncbi:MAG: hypothetical protein R3E96_05270 [Planctomycetota bacterium]
MEKVAENSFERCVRLDFKLTLTAQHPVGPVQGELIVELDDSLVPGNPSTIRGEVQ